PFRVGFKVNGKRKCSYIRENPEHCPRQAVGGVLRAGGGTVIVFESRLSGRGVADMARRLIFACRVERIWIRLINVVEAAQVNAPYVHSSYVENCILKRLELHSQARLCSIGLLMVFHEPYDYCVQRARRIRRSRQPW